MQQYGLDMMRILDTDIDVVFYTENIGLFEGAFLVSRSEEHTSELQSH